MASDELRRIVPCAHCHDKARLAVRLRLLHVESSGFILLALLDRYRRVPELILVGCQTSKESLPNSVYVRKRAQQAVESPEEK